MSLDADVLIAGAGPAGAALATRVAAAGFDVLLVERQYFPRDKICGDFVGAHSLIELSTLGVSDRELSTSHTVRKASFVLNGETLATSEFPTLDGVLAVGKVVPRVDLDAAIFNAARRAGARVIEGVTVVAVESRAGVAELVVRDKDGEHRLRSRIVVGADGSTSAVARSMHGSAHPPGDRIIAVRAYVDGLEGDESCCDLYFSAQSFPGYTWLFPIGSKRGNLGVGMLLETVPPYGEHLRDLLLEFMSSDNRLRERLKNAHVDGRIVGWPLSTYNPTLSLVDDNVLLVGDAAGLINPLNGEGIQYALLSARWAAPIIIDGLCNGVTTRGAFLPYEKTVRTQLGYDMALSRFVVRSIANRALNPMWLSLLRAFCERSSRNKAYAHVAGGILAGLIPARKGLTLPMFAASTAACIDLVMRECQKTLSARPSDTASRALGVAATIMRGGAGLVRHGAATEQWFNDMAHAGWDLSAHAAKATLER
jgi:menaquinone-9 beta-reductase